MKRTRDAEAMTGTPTLRYDPPGADMWKKPADIRYKHLEVREE